LFLALFLVHAQTHATSICREARELQVVTRSAAKRALQSAWIPKVSLSYHYLPRQERPAEIAFVGAEPFWGLLGFVDFSGNDGVLSEVEGERHRVFVSLSWNLPEVVDGDKYRAAEKMGYASWRINDLESDSVSNSPLDVIARELSADALSNVLCRHESEVQT
jgi:hypothetical protein